MSDISKTLDIAAAGDTLYQEEVDKLLQDLIEHNNPLRQNLPRKSGSGQAWIVIRRTAQAGSQFVNDTEEPAADSSDYGRVPFAYKTILVRGKVTRKLQAQGKSLLDIEAEEINAALEVIRDAEENAIFYGDASDNPKEYDGLKVLIPSSQTVDLGSNGGELSLEALDEGYDLAIGNPDMLVGSKRSRRFINGLLQQFQRFVDQTEVKGGFRLMSYNNVPIFHSAQVSDAEVWGTASNASHLTYVDSSKVWMGDLTPVTRMKFPQTSSQFTSFDIFEDTVLVNANPRYSSKIEGIVPEDSSV